MLVINHTSIILRVSGKKPKKNKNLKLKIKKIEKRLCLRLLEL